MRQRISEFGSRIRFKYYEWKCWFIFKHNMKSLGMIGDKQQLYQCLFCFKQIVVSPFGANKGIVNTNVSIKQESLAEELFRKRVIK